MEITDSLDEKKWLNFVQNQASGNIFHTPYMAEVFRRARKYEPIILAAVDGMDDEILSLIHAVKIKVIGSIPSRFASRAVISGGVLGHDSKKGSESLGRIFKSYDKIMRGGTLFTEIRNMAATNNIKKHLVDWGWNYEDYVNYQIDLRRSPDRILQSFSKSLRRNIRKAQKNGIVIEEIEHKEQLSIFYRMLREIYSKIKIPIADISLFESAFDVLHSREMVKYFLARLGNDYVGGRAVLLYKGVILDWYACSNSEYLKFYPNEMLVWHILNRAIENGFHTFDFGGAGRPDERYGVRDFKARFGGRLVNYGRYTKIHSPTILKVSKKFYEFYRRLL